MAVSILSGFLANTASRSAGVTDRGESLHLGQGQALRIGSEEGVMTVLEGCVWLTRDAALGDHFIDAGQEIRFAANENAVIEPCGTSAAATIRWSPRKASPRKAHRWSAMLIGALSALAAPRLGDELDHREWAHR